MIAGQLALLSEPADEPLEPFHDSGYRAVDVRGVQEYLDDEVTIQEGAVAGRVAGQTERVHLDGSEIEVERDETSEKVASEWIGDVVEHGWLVAERTYSTDEDHRPPWPFDQFETRTGVEIEVAHLEPGQFVRNVDDRATLDIEFVGRDAGQSVSMDYGVSAMKKDALNANVGVAFRTDWHGTFVRGVMYASGYVSIWEPSDMLTPQFGRFVHEEILPIAYVPEEDEEETEQGTLDDSSEEVSA